MGQLEIDAINPTRTDSWTSFHWIVGLSRWELTCGFCRNRVGSTSSFVRSSVVCPHCGTRNVLPHSPKYRGSPPPD